MPIQQYYQLDHFSPGIARPRSAVSKSAALARGDDGIAGAFVFVPPWQMAARATSFPDSQADARAAMPSWNAGPQVGGLSSQPGLRTSQLLKAGPGTLFSINVIAAGTAVGAVYDSNVSTSDPNLQIAVIPMTVGLILLEWPCQRGIFLAPGAGQTIAAKWV